MRLKEPFTKGGNGWCLAVLCDFFRWVSGGRDAIVAVCTMAPVD
jgi:hypothetical protein